MPTTFTPDDRARIDGDLRRAGARLFAERGLKKTTLEALTGAAGIAKSSFYAFYDSKEELYLELLAAEGPAIEARLMRASLDAPVPPREAIARFLRGIVAELERHPLTRRLLGHPEELAAIRARVGPEGIAAKARALEPVRTFVLRAQERGVVRPADPDAVVGALRALTLLTLHRDDLEPSYEATMALLIDLIADGLTRPEARP